MSETEATTTEAPTETRRTRRASSTTAGSETLALSTNPAGVAAVAGNVQALPFELDSEQDTPEHRSDLAEPVGNYVDDQGVVQGTELEEVPASEKAEGERNGPVFLQRYPAWPGGPLV
jgi:hypothetical protein